MEDCRHLDEACAIRGYTDAGSGEEYSVSFVVVEVVVIETFGAEHVEVVVVEVVVVRGTVLTCEGFLEEGVH